MEAKNQKQQGLNYNIPKGTYDILVQILHVLPNNEYTFYVLGLVVEFDVDTTFDEESVYDFLYDEILNQRGIEAFQMAHQILQFDFYDRSQTLELVKEINSEIFGEEYSDDSYTTSRILN
jgi:hypothetical protein